MGALQVLSSLHTETFQLLQNSWINLGSDGSGTSGGCDLLSNFDLGEFIIYDRKLSDKEIIDVENYLNKK